MASLPFIYGGVQTTSIRKKSKRRDVLQAKDAGNFQVLKRNQYENEVIRCRTPLQTIPYSYGDRFIPRRYYRKQTSRIPSLNLNRCDENENDIFNIKDKSCYWRFHNYRINIEMALGLNDGEMKMLNVHDESTQQICQRTFNNQPIKIERRKTNISIEELDWSCKPRTTPLAYNDSTHDMPGFDVYEHGDNIIDWNCNGQIAASFDSSLVLWGPPSNDRDNCTVLYELKNIRALRYRPNGQQLALSINDITSSRLQVWEVGNKMSIYTTNSISFPKTMPFETFRCIEWDSTGETLACGSSSGTVRFISYDGMSLAHVLKCHSASISDIKYSANDTFIAIADLSGKVSVLRKKNYELYLEYTKAHFIAWHPWIETNLLIGCKSPASIYLLDLRTKTTIAHYKRTDSQYTLCAMTMNPLSAELVVSFTCKKNGVIRNDILVMASMNRIVDNLSAHQGAVYFMMWDPTATRIFTAGRDESLNVRLLFVISKKEIFIFLRSFTFYPISFYRSGISSVNPNGRLMN